MPPLEIGGKGDQHIMQSLISIGPVDKSVALHFDSREVFIESSVYYALVAKSEQIREWVVDYFVVVWDERG